MSKKGIIITVIELFAGCGIAFLLKHLVLIAFPDFPQNVMSLCFGILPGFYGGILGAVNMKKYPAKDGKD